MQISRTFIRPPFYLAAGENVLVFRKWRMICIAIPKVANTSLRSALASSEGRKLLRTKWRTKLPCMALAQLQAIHGSWPIFSLVRHPRDRLYSCWKDKRAVAPFWRDKPLSQECSFEEFVRWVCEQPDDETLDKHIRSQWWWLTGGTHTHCLCDHVIEMHAASTELPKLLPGIKLPRYNKRTRRAEREAAWTDELKRIHRARFADDFAHLGYT